MSQQEPPLNVDEGDKSVDPKNKNNDNDNGNGPKTEPSKLDYDRDWSTIERKEAVNWLRGICIPSKEANEKLADGEMSQCMKIQLQAAIVGVHGMVNTYGLEDGQLDVQFLHIPVISRAREMVVQWQDQLEDRYQQQQRQQRFGNRLNRGSNQGNVSNANSQPSGRRFNLSKFSYNQNDTVITNNSGNNNNNNSRNNSSHNGNNNNNNNSSSIDEIKSMDMMEDLSSPLEFHRQRGGAGGNVNGTSISHNGGGGGRFSFGQGLQNKRSRQDMEADDPPQLLPGFEKVWNVVSSRAFRGVKPIRDAQNNVMYFWWQAGVPCASITRPHGYAEGDNVNNDAFKSSIRNDDFFGYGGRQNNENWNHSRVCVPFIFSLFYFSVIDNLGSRCTEVFVFPIVVGLRFCFSFFVVFLSPLGNHKAVY